MIIGLFGTSDSGKTTIIESLTDSLTKKYAVEKNKVITLKVNYASYRIDAKDRYFLDLPGHKSFAIETLRNLSHIDLPMYVVDCMGFKDLQKRKTILKHYTQYQSLFRHKKLASILIFNKAESVSKQDLEEFYDTLKRADANFLSAYPLCALVPESVQFLKENLERLDLFKTDSPLKTPRHLGPLFKTIKSFDTNPTGVWLHNIVGGVLGGVRTAPVAERSLLYYYDKLIADWAYVVAKDVKIVNETICTIETLSDPYFFKNDRMKGVLFFSAEQLDLAKESYTDLLKIKVDKIFTQTPKEGDLFLIIDGQLAQSSIKSYKNNILTVRLKKDNGMVYAPKGMSVIALHEPDSGLQKIELFGLGVLV